MTVTMRRTRPLPEHANRAMNTLLESGDAARQSVGNVLRVLTGSVRQYHGIQETIARFYERLREGKGPEIDPASARSVVYWTEAIAHQGDDLRSRTIAVRAPRRLSASTLVTGATGFIGRRLVEALRKNGDPIRVFVRRTPPDAWIDDPLIEVVVGDLGDPAAVDAAMSGI